jgi:hypothetical protein
MRILLLLVTAFIVAHSCRVTAQSKPTKGTAATVTDTMSAASSKPFRLLKTLRGDFNSFEVDGMDNIYVITKGNQLKKYDANGDSVAVYNDVKKYGNPSLIDVTNPLRPLVYFKNFSSIVILDRFLSKRDEINLRQQNIFSVKAIASSYDNLIWLFDEQDFKLKKINYEGKILLETNDWRQIFNPVPQPQNIFDKENFVYLYDVNQGFYIFDYYGSLKSQLPYKGWHHVAVSGNQLYGFDGSVLNMYNIASLTSKQYPLPASISLYEDIKAMNGKLYVLTKGELNIFLLQ